MFNVTVTTPKTPYEADFKFCEDRTEYEDQRKLAGWTFRGRIWADEESGFKTRIRLDSAQCGWMTVLFNGGPDSYIEVSYWKPEELEKMNMFHYVYQLVDRVEDKPTVGFAEQHKFRW